MSSYPAVVKEAIDRGQLQQVTRRVEVLEADAVTYWNDGLGDRLIDGNVNISYGDSERRTLDITFRDDDNLLRSKPNGFWYDKIIKVYRGVKYSPNIVTPSTAIIESVGGLAASGTLISYLARIGLPDAEFKSGTLDLTDLLNYDIVVSYTGTAASTQATLLQELYNRGQNVITISNGNTATQVPFLTGVGFRTDTWGISQPTDPTSLSTGWTTEQVAAGVGGYRATGVGAGAVVVARWVMGDASYGITASVAINGNGGKWFNLHLPNLGASQTRQLFANVVEWLKEDFGEWETQIGEFTIDAIRSPHFPSQTTVTGRDYVKKCANSKIEQAMTFASSTTVETLITALAANAGITKFRMVSMPETIGSEKTFDRGTPRWDVMSDIAKTQGYEIFFDHQGYLTTRPYLDPTLSPESFIFKTGAEGNLSSIDRNVHDSRIYNHIAVYGDPSSSETRFPYFGEAKNTNPLSPTRIDKIGDRYYSYASTFFTSQVQTQQYAERLLGLHSLESFELSFQAINYPWLEVGEIARVEDPKAVETDPTKYLIDSGTIPLGLGPMSLTGKRVLIV
ncbi:MAG: minor tail protein [Phage AS32]|nr:MAG: minor tail protein [Phage AS32]